MEYGVLKLEVARMKYVAERMWKDKAKTEKREE